jgi:hypothetical protein
MSGKVNHERFTQLSFQIWKGIYSSSSIHNRKLFLQVYKGISARPDNCGDCKSTCEQREWILDVRSYEPAQIYASIVRIWAQAPAHFR